jgi:hypothetical protein
VSELRPAAVPAPRVLAPLRAVSFSHARESRIKNWKGAATRELTLNARRRMSGRLTDSSPVPKPSGSPAVKPHPAGDQNRASRRYLPSMNRAQEHKHLAEADRHIADLKAHIIRQRIIVKHALDTGQPSEVAASMLRALEGSLLIFEKHRELILDQLKRLPSE